MTALLSTHKLEIRRGRRRLIQSLDLSMETGQCWGVLGMNGTGKSTLLHTLAGLHADYAGEIALEGRSIEAWTRRQIARHIGLLLQSNDEPFPATVLDTVLMGRHPYLQPWQWESARDYQLAHNVLALMDLHGFESRNIQTLSGGERRRMYIAALLMQQPRVYLLDEPINHLDLAHQHQVLRLLSELKGEAQTGLMMVLHDPNLAWRYCDHVLLLYPDGEVESGETGQLLTATSLSNLYQYPIQHMEQDNKRIFIAG